MKVVTPVNQARNIRPYVPLVVILAGTFLVFLPALSNGLILWDDHSYTWENPFLKNFDFSKVFSFSTFFHGNYHPLTLLWLHLEWVIFPGGNAELYGGLNPFWFHLNNILLHLVNVALVYYLVRELVDRKGWKTAAITAALFAIHPMHVESVVWVSELKDVLYGAFYIGATWMYIRYLRTSNYILLTGAFVLFILSNLAKGQAVTLPVLFFLFDFYKRRKLSLKLVLEKLPFLALSLFFGLLAIKAQQASNAMNAGNKTSLASAINACYGVMSYMGKMFLPTHLSAIHPYKYTELSSFPWYYFLFPLILALLVILSIFSLKKNRDVFFGFFFYLITISVMIKFVPVGDSLLNERYTYIPYIGLFFIAGHFFAQISSMKQWRYLVTGGLAMILVVFSFMTIARISTWKNNRIFWSDIIQKYPEYWRGYFGVAAEDYEAGDWQNALELVNKSCELNSPPVANMLRGTICYNKSKDYKQAIEDFRRVITADEPGSPYNIEARYNLGDTYIINCNFKEAIPVLDDAIRLDPGNPRGYVLKGNAMTLLNRFAEAERLYDSAIRISPASADAYLHRGLLYEDKVNHFEAAISDFRKVLELEPGRRDATINIGISLLKKHSLDEAILQFSRALDIFGEDAWIHYLRALAYREKKMSGEAYNDLMKAKQLGYNVSDVDLASMRQK